MKTKIFKRKGKQRIFSTFNTVIQREFGLFNIVRGHDVLEVGLSFEEAASYIEKYRSEEEEESLTDTYNKHRSHTSNKVAESFEVPRLYSEIYSVPFKMGVDHE